MATWAKDFVLEFINTYREHPALWNTKSSVYRNNFLKEQSYSVLVEKTRTVDPYATKETVKRKINSLRSSFRKELKKVRELQLAGSEYVPRWWYYDHLTFLLTQEPNTDAKHLPLCDSEESDLESTNESDQWSNDAIRLEAKYPSTTVPETINYQKQPPKRYRFQVGDHSQATTTNPVEEPVKDDEYDIFGKLIAAKMRKLPARQRVFAEKMIHDVFFEVELGILKGASHTSSGFRTLVQGPLGTTQGAPTFTTAARHMPTSLCSMPKEPHATVPFVAESIATTSGIPASGEIDCLENIAPTASMTIVKEEYSHVL